MCSPGGLPASSSWPPLSTGPPGRKHTADERELQQHANTKPPSSVQVLTLYLNYWSPHQWLSHVVRENKTNSFLFLS